MTCVVAGCRNPCEHEAYVRFGGSRLYPRPRIRLCYAHAVKWNKFYERTVRRWAIPPVPRRSIYNGDKAQRLIARLRDATWLSVCGDHFHLATAAPAWAADQCARKAVKVTMGACRNITLGADPELVLTRGGRMYAAPDGFQDGDRRTGEVRPDPATTVPGLVQSVRHALYEAACALPADVLGHAGAYTAEHPTGGHIHLHHPGVPRKAVLDAVSGICAAWAMDTTEAIRRRKDRNYGQPGNWRDVPWRCRECGCATVSTEIREPASWLHSPRFAQAFLSAVVRAVFPTALADRLEADPAPKPTKTRPAKSEVFRHWGIHVVGRAEAGTVDLAWTAVQHWPKGLDAPRERIVVRTIPGLKRPEYSGALAGAGPVRASAKDLKSAVVYLPTTMLTQPHAQVCDDVLFPAAQHCAVARTRKLQEA